MNGQIRNAASGRMRTAELTERHQAGRVGAHPGRVPEDFQALDGYEIVGRVYQIPIGPERGLWFWTMTVVRPARRVPDERDGGSPRNPFS
jgi:hypothetical protein